MYKFAVVFIPPFLEVDPLTDILATKDGIVVRAFGGHPPL
jgi:hypothetical protein